MRQEAVNEIQRRFSLLLENATPNTISYGTTGSMMRFNMALNLLGGNMKTKESMEFNDSNKTAITWNWTDEKYNEPILTKDEFHSDEYDSLLKGLFNRLNRTVNNKKSKSK